MMYDYILFQIFHKLPLFLFLVDIYAMQDRSHNISHLQEENPSYKATWLKFRPFLYKIFKEFKNDLYLWKSEVTTIKKDKIFDISLNIAHFWKKISYRASYLLAQYTK